MTIALVCPTYSAYSAKWIESFIGLLLYENIRVVPISPAGGSNVVETRNRCIQDIYIHELEAGIRFEWVLSIDTDVIFKLDHVKKILSSGRDIVSGVYFEKAHPFRPIAGYYDLEKIQHGFPRISVKDIQSCKLIEVDWTGMGFFAFKRNILDEMGYPWYEMRKVKLPNAVKRNGNIMITHELLSEDITFCTKLRELRHKIWVDTSILLKHEGKNCFTMDHFLAVNNG